MSSIRWPSGGVIRSNRSSFSRQPAAIAGLDRVQRRLDGRRRRQRRSRPVQRGDPAEAARLAGSQGHRIEHRARHQASRIGGDSAFAQRIGRPRQQALRVGARIEDGRPHAVGRDQRVDTQIVVQHQLAPAPLHLLDRRGTARHGQKLHRAVDLHRPRRQRERQRSGLGRGVGQVVTAIEGSGVRRPLRHRCDLQRPVVMGPGHGRDRQVVLDQSLLDPQHPPRSPAARCPARRARSMARRASARSRHPRRSARSRRRHRPRPGSSRAARPETRADRGRGGSGLRWPSGTAVSSAPNARGSMRRSVRP